MRSFVAALLVCCAAAVAAQESTLPGGHTASARTEGAQYQAALRAKVDTLLEQWRARADKRDTAWLADLYAPNADIVIASGATYSGREGITRFYAAFLPRIRDLKLKLRDVTRDGGSYVASVQLGFVMPRQSGGAWHSSVPITFVVLFDQETHPTIAHQKMEDLPSIETVASMEQNGGDSVSVVANKIHARFAVRVANIAGVGAGGAHVVFAVTCGQASLSDGDVDADADGIAAVDVTAEARGLPVCVTATSDALPSDPVVFHLRLTTAPPP